MPTSMWSGRHSREPRPWSAPSAGQPSARALRVRRPGQARARLGWHDVTPRHFWRVSVARTEDPEMPGRAGPPSRVDVVGLGTNALDLLGVIDGHPQPDTKSALRKFEVQGGGMIATALV